MTALMMTVAVAGAQTISYTTESGPDDVDIGKKTATVHQTVNLKLPEATALHLDATKLTFDISKLSADEQRESKMYCAYGFGPDVASSTNPNFWNQQQVLPLGTKYETTDTWGEINVIAGEQITSYPPIKKDANKEVDNATKAYFVCYRSFIIQKFSNVGNFKLSVTRNNPAVGEQGRQMMYIQDNPCSTFGGPTGLYKLEPGATRELIPMDKTTGTTGARAAGTTGQTQPELGGGSNKCRPLTSWLDDLVVIAVVVDGDRAGNNNAVLTYTLESKDTPFELADSDATGN
ncbi:hypothetical protein ACFP9V_20405 [Deinococcus radiopugnans]